MKTFLRRLAILDYLRSSRAYRSTDEILNHLVNSDYLEDESDRGAYLGQSERSLSAQRRTVQRDLNFLYGTSNVLNLEGDNDFGLEALRGEGKSLMWSIDPYSGLSYDFEKMPTYLALSFSMTQKHLSAVMPSNTLSEMERFFQNADTKLQKEASRISPQQFGRLKDSVEFYQRGQRLQAANYDINTLDTVYRAILKGKQLRISYRGKTYQVHPFGVVILLPKLYLVAKKNEDIEKTDSYRHFLIHKIDDIEVISFSSNIPETFSLSAYLDEGRMDVYVNQTDQREYKLVLQLSTDNGSNLITDLSENPISGDQVLLDRGEGCYELTATVKRTVQLKNWIMALGRVATIVSPDVIRNDIFSELQALLSNYSEDTG
ncbi:helix-turn-helix transcriptional regulator [Alkalimarinus coralli]|uniref:helix-turn-helix transcriptional regulator n=1 Tax=Alkalimarinus coralli TaxID=2935863 RepID=UPI00202B53F2|nr:WYL domain-containing protein [Alkalimarinus coralli]